MTSHNLMPCIKCIHDRSTIGEVLMFQMFFIYFFFHILIYEQTDYLYSEILQMHTR